MRPETIQKGALVGLAFLLAAVAVVVATPPANQYEISMYDAFPPYFWVFVVGAMLVGVLVIVASVKVPNDRSWAYGLGLVLLTNVLLLSLPLSRGYRMYGQADPMSHLGFIHDISTSGGLGGNIYTPAHLLALTLAEATGANEMTLAMVIPVLFSGVYFGGMFYLLVALFDSREQVLFALPFAALPILRPHLLFRPYDLSVMLVPFVLYLFFKSQRYPYPSMRLTFVVGLVALVLYHPLTALFLVGIFGFYFVGRYVPRIGKQFVTPTHVVSLSVAVFLAWYSNYASIIVRFDRVYETLFGLGGEDSPMDGYTATRQQVEPSFADLVQVGLFRYGLAFALFALGFAFVVLALVHAVRGTYTVDSHTFMLGGVLALFSVGGTAFLVFDLIVPHDRPFQLAKIAAAVLAGQLFYLLWTDVNWKETRAVASGFHTVLVAVLLVLVVLSVVTLFPSPLSTEVNDQVTEMEIEGNAWIAEHGTAAGTLVEFDQSHRRFHHAEHGVDDLLPFSTTRPPDHLGYDGHERLGESYPGDAYLSINRLGRLFYPEVFPAYADDWRYAPEDFERLERDSTVDRVYDNGDYTQYLVD